MRKASIIAAAIVIAVVGAGWAAYYFVLQPASPLVAPRLVSIKRGESLRLAARQLHRAEVIRNSEAEGDGVRLLGEADRRGAPVDTVYKADRRVELATVTEKNVCLRSHGETPQAPHS